MKPSSIKCAIAITGLLFAASSHASLSPVDQAAAQVQYQNLVANAAPKAAGIQLAARTISRTSTTSSATGATSGAGSISSPFFTRYVPSTAVGATVVAPGTGITPTPRVIKTRPSWSAGFVRRYTQIRRRATYIPVP